MPGEASTVERFDADACHRRRERDRSARAPRSCWSVPNSRVLGLWRGVADVEPEGRHLGFGCAAPAGEPERRLRSVGDHGRPPVVDAREDRCLAGCRVG